ncbi:hypothetical protein N803_04205 [Knoellia subterranea KCTC 19937]|uniref:Uncharacterized protein n=1 Tax=Knoellia subterranea KCTC 19937 TaxID=1385521 RepID=A0A0A0JHS9_9MICO|nr:hypothetical protein N803_04205 [Knoellia subterranea KCTC 19937]
MLGSMECVLVEAAQLSALQAGLSNCGELQPGLEVDQAGRIRAVPFALSVSVYASFAFATDKTHLESQARTSLAIPALGGDCLPMVRQTPRENIEVRHSAASRPPPTGRRSVRRSVVQVV